MKSLGTDGKTTGRSAAEFRFPLLKPVFPADTYRHNRGDQTTITTVIAFLPPVCVEFLSRFDRGWMWVAMTRKAIKRRVRVGRRSGGAGGWGGGQAMALRLLPSSTV